MQFYLAEFSDDKIPNIYVCEYCKICKYRFHMDDLINNCNLCHRMICKKCYTYKNLRLHEFFKICNDCTKINKYI